MTILEMIAEWRRGCSCARKGHPEECTECTVGLIEAIERKEFAKLEQARLKAIPRCSCCGTTENLHKDFGSGGPYRCNSMDCVVF